ncbi:hypothetical protein SAMN06269185_1052 [Natronoarchaeum philippinense]|uniref:Uncharacterized protein n=1 Tax=Natronoarchaeum philippinense TaxID=558529 RepID=A0A285N9Y1_NATPI|nr:hypothetical protein [Natronoarchaeum philippinense]SNZ06108.1 hypothetical protein SAMN06269185_1052 [Natronoarchaeum philippinense]
MHDTDSETAKWKRRERSLAAGLVLWALFVSAYVTLYPEQAATWLTTRSSLVVAGTIMVSIGLFGGICDSAMALAARWVEPDDEEDLTSVPWDEE